MVEKPEDDLAEKLKEIEVRLHDRETMTDNLLDIDIVRPEGLVDELAGRTISIDELSHVVGGYCQEHKGTDPNKLFQALAPAEALATMAGIYEQMQQQAREFEQEYRKDNKHLRD